MIFEWDLRKAESNKNKHKVSFEEAIYLFADKDALTIYDEEHSDYENRWVTIGFAKYSKMLVVVHTHRESKESEIIRIISARKATKNETEQYFNKKGGNK